jgi:cob(I)alamin adenosyltransferase
MRSFRQRMHHGGGGGVGTVAIVAAALGVVAGAAVVIAGAMTLSNEKNRAKLKSILNDARNKITGLGKDIDTKVEVEKDKVEKKMIKGSKKLIRKASKILVAKKN